MTYNNKDGVVRTSKCDKGVIITYLDENDYIKKAKALKMYYMRTYKDLIFNVNKQLKSQSLKDGDYEIELFTEENFKKVYGAIILKYFVKDNIVFITDIEPGDLLIDLYMVLVDTYKGVPYRNKKDLFKIKMLLGGK